MRKGFLVLAGIVLLPILLLTGCIPVMTIPVIQDEDTIQVSFDEAWEAVITSLAEMALPFQVIEKESGLVSTEFVTFTRGLFADKQIDLVAQRPFILLGTWYQGRYAFNVLVTSIDENITRIKITTHIEGFEDNLTGRWHVCYSKGVIEGQIFDSVREILELPPIEQ